MAKFVALLRGINVGGKNKILMADLRQLLESAKLKNAQTYIQSGNIVFESTAKEATLAKKITKLIKSEYDFDVPTLVISKQKLKKIFATNPLTKHPIEQLCASVLGEKPEASLVETLLELDFGDDEIQIKNDVAFLRCPNGFSRTKLTNNFLERKLKTTATTRNWKTMTKLLELCE